MTAIMRNFVTLGVFVGIVGTQIGSAYAQTCKTNIALEDPATRQVCTTWDDVGDPELMTDFTVDYLCTGCSDAPRVEFIRGGSSSAIAWEIYSEVLDAQGNPTGPANLGDVVLADNVVPNEGKFTVGIYKSGIGALNVSSIVLNSTDVDWTGHSTLTSTGSYTLINGNVTGDIVVIERTGNGGKAEGTSYIFGDVQGKITIPHVTGSLTIRGNVSQDIDLCDITNGLLSIEGSIAGNLTVSDKISAGVLTVGGDVPVGKTVHIEDVTGASTLTLSSSGYSLDGDLDLVTGIPDAATLVIINILGGTVDLTGDDVVGQLLVSVGTVDATIVNGGAVSGIVSLSYYAMNDFEGTATFASVSKGGLIRTWQYGELSGTLNVTQNVAGIIGLEGPFNSGGAINIGGSVSGDITLHNAAGSTNIANDLFGDVQIEYDLTGSVTVGGALANGSLMGGGRILVGGESSGPIRVGKNTGSLTLIQVVEGLATGATIEINTTEGAFDAEGDIHIGPGATAPVPLPFDGCIRIYDKEAGGGGALNGNITIVACHDPFEEILMICIDGTVNGNVTLEQTGCNGVPATWGCPSPGCP